MKSDKGEERIFQDLMSKTWPEPPIDELTLSKLGTFIDLSEDFGSEEGLKKALDLASLWESGMKTAKLRPILYYVTSNIHYALWHLRNPEKEHEWDWEQPEIEEQVRNLRRCINDPEFLSIPTNLQCRAYTNLGNSLSRIGRPVEAIREWLSALSLEPGFPEAEVNLGIGLTSYGNLVHDGGHAALVMKQAFDILEPLDPKTMDELLLAEVSRCLKLIRNGLTAKTLEGSFPTYEKERDWQGEEKEYREWAQSEGLFLNSLNDIGLDELSGRDTMCAPTMRYGIDEKPWANSIFNELKQEYVSARYLIWTGTHQKQRHWSDEDVAIVNTMDYPAIGLNTQSLRSGFRMAYSILDKVAGFLNHYLKLGLPEHRVNFSRIWKAKIGGLEALPLRKMENWPLRGLYWLSRDFFVGGASEKALDPEARRLWTIRQFIEHKVLKIHDLDLTPIGLDDAVKRAGIPGELSMSVTRKEMEKLSVGLLRRVRAAFIHLLMAVHVEEMKKAAATPEGQFVPEMHEQLYEDEWKD